MITLNLQYIIYNKKVIMCDLGLMEFHGPFGGSLGYHGHLIDILKSGLQKYIRRGEKEKAIRCAIDLDLFYLFEPKSKGIRTNMINRLRIISCEEFCWGNPRIFNQMQILITSWSNHRNSDRIKGTRALIEIVNLLCSSRPARMISFIRAAYKHGPLYSEIKHKYSEIYKNLTIPIQNLEDVNLSKQGDTDILSSWINQFNYFFQNKSDKCIYWAFKIMNIKDKCARRYRRTGPEYILWEYLFEKLDLTISQKKPIDVLFNWYKNNKSEHWMYLINAIMICLQYKKLNIASDIDAYYSIPETSNLSEIAIKNIVQNHKKTKFEIDDYCIDQHTEKGRKKNRGPIHFAKIGSYVENENLDILNKTYKDIYLDLKYIRENKPVSCNKKMLNQI